jgi:outer membrane immunogenic protein
MRILNAFTISTLASIALAPIYTKLAIAEEAKLLHGGAYVGITAGVISKGASIKRNPAPGRFELVNTNASFGVVGGYNWVFKDRYMLGLEADLSTAGSGFSKTDATLGAVKTSANFVGSLRGRAGVTWNSALFYGTVGLAFSDISTTPAGVSSKGDFKVGLVAGLGIEYAINYDWSARLEGLVYSFGNDSTVFAGTKRNTDMGFTTIRLGLTKKF